EYKKKASVKARFIDKGSLYKYYKGAVKNLNLKKAVKLTRDELISEFYKLKKAEGALDRRFTKIKRLIKDPDEIKIIRTPRLKGTPVTFTLDVSYIQPERIALTKLKFKNRDIDTIDNTELIKDRIRSLEL
ncbi:hypothetical protein N7471_003593, partial [Penicillium samsonianum]|uniref:uncharacterized protein n=1 Tax=Penicillium samsonianum TaxID=1882272 RepID=UPI0025477ED1